MDQHQYLVKEYGVILELSEQMLALAKAEKWDELIGLEISYLQAVEAVTQQPLSDAIPASVSSKIRESLVRILENETQLKSLLNGRLKTLSEIIGQSIKRQEVNTAYSRF
ncbi:flagella biosynthesis regulatory protein FliT [Rouxiella sp. Mn2063]|uniref:flagella biosynthesis regulatory protein FliT n=1 Tax=Rouxiella sp. Mn2063 TaxID=3395262 RepID=UPI003BE1F6DD